MRRCTLFILLFPLFVNAQNPIEKEGWKLTFNDEFNDRKLDYTKWQDHYYWGGRFNKDGICYYDTDQFQFTDSTLLIVADKSPNKENLPYSSGLIDNHKSFKQQYGYFEIRSKNPKGEGFWTAFWLVSTEQWPPEIDIYEFYTIEPNNINTNQHWLTKRNKRKQQPKNYNMKVDGSDGFHIYAVEWTKKKIVWYYDNKKIKTSRRGRKYFTFPMHIIINNEVSETNDMNLENTIFPNNFEIDYVRVYKRKE